MSKSQDESDEQDQKIAQSTEDDNNQQNKPLQSMITSNISSSTSHTLSLRTCFETHLQHPKLQRWRCSKCRTLNWDWYQNRGNNICRNFKCQELQTENTITKWNDGPQVKKLLQTYNEDKDNNDQPHLWDDQRKIKFILEFIKQNNCTIAKKNEIESIFITQDINLFTNWQEISEEDYKKCQQCYTYITQGNNVTYHIDWKDEIKQIELPNDLFLSKQNPKVNVWQFETWRALRDQLKGAMKISYGGITIRTMNVTSTIVQQKLYVQLLDVRFLYTKYYYNEETQEMTFENVYRTIINDGNNYANSFLGIKHSLDNLFWHVINQRFAIIDEWFYQHRNKFLTIGTTRSIWLEQKKLNVIQIIDWDISDEIYPAFPIIRKFSHILHEVGQNGAMKKIIPKTTQLFQDESEIQGELHNAQTRSYHHKTNTGSKGQSFLSARNDFKSINIADIMDKVDVTNREWPLQRQLLTIMVELVRNDIDLKKFEYDSSTMDITSIIKYFNKKFTNIQNSDNDDDDYDDGGDGDDEDDDDDDHMADIDEDSDTSTQDLNTQKNDNDYNKNTNRNSSKAIKRKKLSFKQFTALTTITGDIKDPDKHDTIRQRIDKNKKRSKQTSTETKNNDDQDIDLDIKMDDDPVNVKNTGHKKPRRKQNKNRNTKTNSQIITMDDIIQSESDTITVYESKETRDTSSTNPNISTPTITTQKIKFRKEKKINILTIFKQPKNTSTLKYETQNKSGGVLTLLQAIKAPRHRNPVTATNITHIHQEQIFMHIQSQIKTIYFEDIQRQFIQSPTKQNTLIVDRMMDDWNNQYTHQKITQLSGFKDDGIELIYKTKINDTINTNIMKYSHSVYAVGNGPGYTDGYIIAVWDSSQPKLITNCNDQSVSLNQDLYDIKYWALANTDIDYTEQRIMCQMTLTFEHL